jgi:putative drug exporter of the RND superfamily
MQMATERLARASARRPWVTVGVWLVLLVAGILGVSRLLGGVLTNEFEFTNEPESIRAERILEDRLRGPERVTEFLILISPSLSVDDPEFQDAVEEAQADLQALGPSVVASTASFYQSDDPTLVSEDRHATLVPIVMTGTMDDAQENADRLHEVTDRIDGDFRALVAGEATLFKDFNDLAEEDLRRGESIGILVALVVLAVVFGALVAALLPIAMAVVAIVLALAGVALVGQAFDFSFFVTNMVTMMGLAVGIDYSLFIVSRFREERRRGRDKEAAIAATGSTASRAVFFSGMTVVLALVGMLIVPTTIFRSLAAGAILVVLTAVAAALTLLPAVLGILGDRVNAVRILRRRRTLEDPDPRGGFWDRVTRGVMRRPVISLVLGGGLLLAAAIPYFGINTGFSGVSTLPDDIESKQAFSVLATEFSGGLTQPVEIVVDGDVGSAEVQAGIDELRQSLEADPAFGPSAVQRNEPGDLALVSVPLRADPSSDAATDAVARLREEVVPGAFDGVDAEVLVGGQTAMSKDFFDVNDRYTPIVFVLVLGLSFLLLTVVFRSIVVPVKAIIMNLLSVGAAYGLVVLVFQEGVGADLFGFTQVEAIEAWLPLFLFSVLFGLSMDYHVFLLSRIREHYDLTGDNTESVAYGLRTTAGIITGAALIMVAVFLGFASGNLVMLQQMGFGLAVAVFLDATIVRTVLVPASMRLLGNLNWYLPRWLQWLPRLNVEGHAGEAPVVAGATRSKEPARTASR